MEEFAALRMKATKKEVLIKVSKTKIPSFEESIELCRTSRNWKEKISYIFVFFKLPERLKIEKESWFMKWPTSWNWIDWQITREKSTKKYNWIRNASRYTSNDQYVTLSSWSKQFLPNSSFRQVKISKTNYLLKSVSLYRRKLDKTK